MQTWLWNKVKIFRREQSTRHRLATTGCLSSWISINPYARPHHTDAQVAGNCQQQNAWWKIFHSANIYIIALMPILLSIMLLHTQARYLRSMIPWPAQPIYTIHICYSAWRLILYPKTYVELVRLIYWNYIFRSHEIERIWEASRVSVRTAVGVWGFPAFSLGILVNTKRF